MARQVRPYLRDEVASSRRLQHLLTEILATEGYFSPQFEFAVDEPWPPCADQSPARARRYGRWRSASMARQGRSTRDGGRL